MVALLLDSGADVNKATADGYTLTTAFCGDVRAFSQSRDGRAVVGSWSGREQSRFEGEVAALCGQ
jgi:hypothetical protein